MADAARPADAGPADADDRHAIEDDQETNDSDSGDDNGGGGEASDRHGAAEGGGTNVDDNDGDDDDGDDDDGGDGDGCLAPWKQAAPSRARGRRAKPAAERPARKSTSSVAAFGNRQLTTDQDVYSHNAWDKVEWGPDQAAEADAVVAQHRTVPVPPTRPEEHDAKAAAYWDQFYSVHRNKFFKDRNWLRLEFPELFAIPDGADKFAVLEVGCGVGNTLFPLLIQQPDPRLFAYACDFAATAINIIKESHLYEPARSLAFVCDIDKEPLNPPIPDGSLDVVVMIFVLSALPRDRMPAVLAKIRQNAAAMAILGLRLVVDEPLPGKQALKPGGVLLLRDYGRYDLAQLRFKPKNVLGDNFYARGDGTRVYFFTEEDLAALMTEAGFAIEQNTSDRRLIVNRTRRLQMYRVWQQGKYRKPAA